MALKKTEGPGPMFPNVTVGTYQSSLRAENNRGNQKQQMILALLRLGIIVAKHSKNQTLHLSQKMEHIVNLAMQERYCE